MSTATLLYLSSIGGSKMKNRVLTVKEYGFWYKNHLCADFPANEIKPLEDIIDLQASGKYDVIVYEEGDCIVGYATIWKHKGNSAYLLDYLGVPESLRNKGIGRKILRSLKADVIALEQNLNICLILESETPFENDNSEENEIRKRRIGFYERNGWVKMYEMATCGMRFNAMSYEVVPDNLDLIKVEHKKVYEEKRTDVIIPLPKGDIPPLPYWMKE